MDPIIATIITTGSASLLNFIATKAYNSIKKENRNFLWKNKERNILKLTPLHDSEEIKKRVRIVVIDDENGFPIKHFQTEGYAIEKWDKVTDISYGKLESGFYDIIVLDIKGVAQDISSDDGLGVLENIKKNNPAQIIIAYSQHSYDLDKTKFFLKADDYIAKPSDFLRIKNTIDAIISTKFNPERYLKSLEQVLQNSGMSVKEIKAINAKLYESVKKKNTPDWKNIIELTGKSGELLKQIGTLTTTILKFFQ